MNKLDDISSKINVDVNTQLQALSDNDADVRSIYTYNIDIANNSVFKIQLLRRHWVIIDSLAGHRNVDGEGVVGNQPIIEPGASFSYQSWCPLQSEYGVMYGYYTFRILDTGDLVEVDIPEFHLRPEFSLN